MRIVLYDKKKFTQKDITLRVRGIIITFVVCCSFLATWAFTLPEDKVEKIPQETIMLVLREEHSFSEEKLIAEVSKYNCRFAHIIIAQAKIESGGFKSRLFLEQNNCFGFRIAGQRLSLNIGERNGYASFDTWKDCVAEYMLYYSSFLRHIKTEEEYYRYLSENYAGDPLYINKLKDIVNTKNNKP